MLIAAVDDLLFSSKIRAAAKAAGIEVTFARSPDAVVEEVRRGSARLVVLDLNSHRVNALAAISALKLDPELATVPTLGFVSHVDAVTTDAALRAGIDDVVSRGAFTARLPEILERAR